MKNTDFSKTDRMLKSDSLSRTKMTVLTQTVNDTANDTTVAPRIHHCGTTDPKSDRNR